MLFMTCCYSSLSHALLKVYVFQSYTIVYVLSFDELTFGRWSNKIMLKHSILYWCEVVQTQIIIHIGDTAY